MPDLSNPGDKITLSDATTTARMIQYATAYPTQFIFDTNGDYDYLWCVKQNDHLWDNGFGCLYLCKGLIYKLIYGSCSKGCRVAPKDMWNIFTVDGQNKGSQTTNDMRDATFNASNRNSLGTQHGYHFYYTAWQTGSTDFYPASGFRSARPVRCRMSAPAVTVGRPRRRRVRRMLASWISAPRACIR